MKKFYTFATAMIIALTATMFTSCDEDQMIGMTLEGTWAGDMYVSSTWNGRVYEATYTELEFSADPFRITRGYGYWVDYYSNAPWDYIASHIRWEVRNSVIRVDFIEDQYSLYISDYRLNDRTFVGNIYTDNGGEKLSFRLHSTDPEDWERYNYGWDYWGDYGYYGYAKQNTWAEEGDTTDTQYVSTEAMTERPQRHIGRK